MKQCLYMWNRKGGGNVGLYTEEYSYGNKEEATGCWTFIWTLASETGGGAEKRVLKKYGWDDFAISNTPIKATHYCKCCVWTTDFFIKYSTIVS